jgi:hypothetical protein
MDDTLTPVSHDNPTQSWDTVAAAWQVVARDLAALGSEIARTYRSAFYAGEPSTPGPGRADPITEVSGAIERTLHAARETLEVVGAELSASGRASALTTEIESALEVSLREAGRTLRDLADQISRT